MCSSDLAPSLWGLCQQSDPTLIGWVFFCPFPACWRGLRPSSLGHACARQARAEVGYGLALPLMQAVLDVEFQRGARPALRDGALGIPFARAVIGQLSQQGDDVEPR